MTWFARTFDAGASRITAPVPRGTDAVTEPAPVAGAETFGPDLVPIWSDSTKLRDLQGF